MSGPGAPARVGVIPAAWVVAPAHRTPDYARMCTLDASDRIRLAGLPAPSAWAWDPDQPRTVMGVARIRRVDPPVPNGLPAGLPDGLPDGLPAGPPNEALLDALLLDRAGRLRLPPQLRDWLALPAHDRSPGSPPRQVVVVAAAPFAVLAVGATWILGGLLGGLLAPAPSRDAWELTT